jgi:hypothetical protein
MEIETEGIKIKFDDGTEYRLPDISYEKFTEHMFKSGCSDVEYDKYCRENNMKELTDFNGESTGEITLIVEQPYRGRVLKFRCIYDSDNDENFNEVSYFGTDI